MSTMFASQQYREATHSNALGCTCKECVANRHAIVDQINQLFEIENSGPTQSSNSVVTRSKSRSSSVQNAQRKDDDEEASFANFELLLEASSLIEPKDQTKPKIVDTKPPSPQIQQQEEECQRLPTSRNKNRKKHLSPATMKLKSTPAIRERMFKCLAQIKTPCTWELIQGKVVGNRARLWDTLCLFVTHGIVSCTGKGRRGQPFKYVINQTNIDTLYALEQKLKAEAHEKPQSNDSASAVLQSKPSTPVLQNQTPVENRRSPSPITEGSSSPQSPLSSSPSRQVSSITVRQAVGVRKTRATPSPVYANEINAATLGISPTNTKFNSHDEIDGSDSEAIQMDSDSDSDYDASVSFAGHTSVTDVCVY